MKKVIIVHVLIMLSVSSMMAQNQKPASTATKPPATKPQTSQGAKGQAGAKQPPVNLIGDHFAKKYSVATRWNDYDVAKDAMYDLIIEYPGSDSLIYALAYFYYENQKYPSSILVCRDLLARNPKNPPVLELAGSSYEALNIYDKALENFESLFLVTNNTLTLYKMAFLQYELKRYPESITNADILLSKPDVDTLKVVFNNVENKPQDYAMKVSLLNLKGMAYKDQSDKENAKKFFEEALQVAPDFLPAKQNLATIK